MSFKRCHSIIFWLKLLLKSAVTVIIVPYIKGVFSVIVLRIFLYHWFSVVCLWCSYKWLILVFIVAGFLIFIHWGHSASLIYEMLSLFLNQILKYLNIKRIFNHMFFSIISLFSFWKSIYTCMSHMILTHMFILFPIFFLSAFWVG